mgnify:CR=1 FL=1|jgi:predicted house-cleaning noncanonical NTP pyrophosphatase (MazG superfamily)
MKKITHNKLVRDKIPELLKKKNILCKIKILNDKEYKESLNKKLQEEVSEFLASKDNEWLEEMADIFEVMLAILKTKNSNFEKLEKIRKLKFDNKGGFSEKILLEKTL